ncbi:MAG: DUF1573 domain-containing protein [Planctomycetota bacterium]|jgi:hypothetical protein
MKRGYFYALVSVVVAVFAFQAGCEEVSKVAEKPAPGVSKEGIDITKSEDIEAKSELKKDAQDEKITDGPVITFEETVHDFGEVSPGKSYTCEFKFSNTGNELLKIGNVTKSCGCTPYTLKKREYKPGEEGVLKVKYHSSDRAGKVTKLLAVHSNAKNTPKVGLRIKANIVIKVSHEPETLNLLLKKENASCPVIKLRSLDGKPFSIKKFLPSNKCMTADFDPNKKAIEFTLQPKVDMEKLGNNPNGRILIWLTHPDCSSITIYFKALPEFKSTPSRIFVMNAKPLKPAERTIWLLNNYNEDFEVESTSSKEGTVKVLSKEKDKNRYKFVVQIMPPEPKGDTKIFKDEFYINLKGREEKFTIELSGFYSRRLGSN